MTRSRNHHYVPQWYQRRFLGPGQTRLYYYDKQPVRKVGDRLVDTRKVQHWGTSKCFAERDLYALRIGKNLSSEFESYFFGEVDRIGALSVGAISNLPRGGWLREEELLGFLNFLSIQQLRTVQGLDWLLATYKARSQNELMRLVASLQHFRCAMWAEGHHQILVAPESGPGFIISDSPVTFFNKASYPGSLDCKYPRFPSPKWKGTQTIYPLDARKCVVFTNLEFARNHKMKLGLRRERTNARDFGATIMRLDDFEHRDVDSNDVLKINLILRCFSRRYIASPEISWLDDLPRMGRNPQWPKLGDAIFPVEIDPLKYGGTTYIGFNDGKVLKQDEFGRRPRSLVEQARAEAEAKGMRDHVEQLLARDRAEKGQ